MRRKLCDRRARIFRWWLEWTIVCNRFWSDNDGTGVYSELAHRSLHFFSCINNFSILFIFFVGFLELMTLREGLLERHSGDSWDEFRECIHLYKAESESLSCILHSGSGSECPECTDLRHMIFSIFFAHICEDFVASRIREIDVNVGHTHTSGIEKSFEEKSVFEWINIGNSREVCEYRPCCRSSSGSYRYSITFRIPDKVCDDTEVSIETHDIYDGEFILESSNNGFFTLA